MYRRTTTLLLLILLTSIPFARAKGQNRMADSLRALIAQAPTSEKKAHEMLALSRTLGNSKQQTEEERAQLMREVKNIAKEQKSLLLDILAELGLANIDYQRKKTNEAETRLNEQLIRAKALKEKYPQASALGILGLIYRSKNEQAKAINAFEQAVSLAENKAYLLMPIHFTLGETYAAQGKGDLASKHYLLALKAAETERNTFIQMACYYGIGNVARQNKDFEQGHEYADKCLSIATATKDPVGQMRGTSLKASLYQQSEQFEKGLEFSEKELGLRKQLKDSAGMATTLNNMAIALLKLDKPEEASVKALEANRMALKFANKVDQANVMNSLILTELRTGKLEEAAQHLVTFEKAAEKMKSFTLLKDAYSSQMELHSRKGDFEKALRYLTKANAMRDSIFNSDKNKTIQELRLSYETEKKEQAIKDLEKNNQIKTLENERQKLFTAQVEAALGRELSEKERIALAAALERTEKEREIKELEQREKIQVLENEQTKAENQRKQIIMGSAIALLAFGLVMAGLFFSRYRTKQRNQMLQTELAESKKRLALEQERTESELKALKSQMNPHFMFNALTTVQEQIMQGSKGEAYTQLGNFATLTRQVLSASGKKHISLEEEVEMLTLYLDFEKKRFGDSFLFDIDLADDIDPEELKIPPMLVQPYAENAMKHGLLHKTTGDRLLKISFSMENDTMLRVEIEDNGVGRKKSAEFNAQKINKSHQSFATAATGKRLELLNLGLDTPITSEIIDLYDTQGAATGTKAIIFVPVLGY